MTYRTRHEFKDGANILGAQLATCAHCKVLRVTDEARHPQPRYILPGVKDAALRDVFDAPPCLSATEPRGAAERVAGMNRARRREAAVREAVNAAPRVVPEPEVAPQKLLPNFPWFADMQR
jgi:hypothetical protein